MQSSGHLSKWSFVARKTCFHKELLVLNFWNTLKLLPHSFGLTLLQILFSFPHLDRLRNCSRAIISKEKFLFHPVCDFSLPWALETEGHSHFSLILYLGYVMCFLLIYWVPSGLFSARIVWQESAEELLSALFVVTRFNWNFLLLLAILRFSWGCQGPGWKVCFCQQMQEVWVQRGGRCSGPSSEHLPNRFDSVDQPLNQRKELKPKTYVLPSWEL